MLNVISLSNRRSIPLRPRSVGRLLTGWPINSTVSLRPDGGFSSGGSTVARLLDPGVRIGLRLAEPGTSQPHPTTGSVEEEDPSSPGVPTLPDDDGTVQDSDPPPSQPPSTGP